MRVSLKRAIQWVCALALIQAAVYYWSISSSSKARKRTAKSPHSYLPSPDSDDGGTCTNNNCPAVMEDVLNVHLIPHSHIDVGWLKTVDQYYTGESVPDYYNPKLECTKCTLNSTIQQLLKDPTRRFIFIEMVYFKRFWNEATDSLKAIVKQLIKERRLEIINGGWVMSDAGCTMYNDIIDQHTLGFDFIRETFGPCAQTKVAWHVDQFGHTREHASIFAQMGYDALFVGRIDFQDHEHRVSKKNLEMVWSTSPDNYGDKGHLFTQTTYDGYYAPPRYVMDDMSYDVFPSKNSHTFRDFIHLLEIRAKAFRTNHLIVPMGSDFGYTKPANWFTNMDKLISLVKEERESGKLKMNIFYSTPSCYIHNVNKDKKAIFEVKQDDFHPYGISPGAYWTGYFTTRGGLKMHVKKAGFILQSCKQLSIFTGLEGTYTKVNKLRDAMAILQHHDAITGTQKKHVLKDYNRLLSGGTKQCQSAMSMALQRLWNYSGTMSSYFCYNLNISSCAVSEGSKPFAMTLYNPMSWSVEQWVRLPVTLMQPSITDHKNKAVTYQIANVPESVIKIPERSTRADVEAVFKTTLPPMSTSTFWVQPARGGVIPLMDPVPKGKEVFLENEYITLLFDSKTGLLSKMVNKESLIELPLKQSFSYYEGMQGGMRSSGAYVFIPTFPRTTPVGEQKRVYNKIIKGPLVEEIHQTFSPWVSQVIRLYAGAKHAEFQWVVGPIPSHDARGREVVSQFVSDIDNKGVFYTDSNGREIMKRKRDFRETWEYQVRDKISGNYYPVTSRIFIQDEAEDVQLTILPDRSQGGSSLKDGCLELMVHRKLLFDDGLGVGEALDDQGIDNKGIIFTGKHYVVLDTIAKSAKRVKHLALQLQFAPAVMFTRFRETQAPSGVLSQHSFLNKALPDNVQVLTLDFISNNVTNLYLLRLEHVFEMQEDAEMSKPVSISLQKLFEPFDIATVEETTLGGNFHPHEISRLQWKTEDGPTETEMGSDYYTENLQAPFTITMDPMEIRTFRVQVARS